MEISYIPVRMVLAPSEPTDGTASDRTPLTLVMSRTDEFLITLVTALRDVAQFFHYNMTVLNANQNQAQQLRDITDARNRGESSIIVNLVDASATADVLQAASGMNVVLINSQPQDLQSLGPHAVFVGPDECLAGTLQGQWLARSFLQSGQSEFRYLLFTGDPGLTSTQERTRCLQQALEGSGTRAIAALPPIAANYNQEMARAAMHQILLQDGVQFDAVIANDDAMALGAIAALEETGIDPSTLRIVGIDATAAGLQAVQDGALSMTVSQDAEAQAAAIFNALYNMNRDLPINTGTPFHTLPDNPYVILIPPETVTLSNVDSFF